MNIFKRIYCRSFQFVMKVAIPFLPYRIPKILSQVEEIIPILKAKRINRICIVTDQGIQEHHLLDAFYKVLEENQINYAVYDKTIPNPTIDQVEEARALYLEKHCEGIVAVGGGSPMDLAKAMGARIVCPKKSVKKMKGLLHIRKRLPLLFAVPTTAGTGSETTLAAVIVDSNTHHKYPINDFSLIPKYAILDYHITLTLPKPITSTTGMDALTHAVEAFIGKSRTPQTKRMAIEAVCLIHKHLLNCYQHPESVEDRKGMLYAAHYAGIAFTKSYVGYIHAIAHSLGGQYHLPHGLANAILLPLILEEYGSKVYKRLSILAKKSGIAEAKDSKEAAAKKFISWIYEMNASMNIPRKVPGIIESDIPQMATYANQEGNPLYPVPVLMDKKQLMKLYYKVKE
ncbi:MAG: iron-containing alcohol dehydrogenase [Anaeroplasmataceae bacterium]|nr:iron-containing alcohol dehydrogenase [Anaeroplasmataceae bacterium]